MSMPSSLEIAQAARLRPVAEIAGALGLGDDEWEPYGRYKGKIDLSVIDRLADRPDGKLVCVTAITPTKSGEGKTTTSVSLTQGLGKIGANPVLCLREASLGPVFGVKGGAAGGGYAQVVPMEDLNLHFTGDIHAITAANNLLAAMLEAHLLHGNALGIDPQSISWRRCLDMNDRSLRQLVLGLGGKVNGIPRETGFDITAASEVMAIVAVSRDLRDLRRRLGPHFHWYNHHRTHHGLGGLLVPADRFYGRVEEVLARIECGQGAPDALDLATRTLDLFRVTSSHGRSEVWLMGRKVFEGPEK